MKEPSSLFARTSLTIFISLFIFLAFAALVVYQNLMSPIARQASGDMAALMVLSAQTWLELPDEARPRFEKELQEYHQLYISNKQNSLQEYKLHHPFFDFLEDALSQRLDQPVQLKQQPNDSQHVWVDLPVAQQVIRIGFPYTHIEPNPPMVIFLVLSGAAVLIFFTSSLLVRRLTLPLEKLSRATVEMGRGHKVELLEETGAKELTLLARSFNQMNERVQQLLENRTTLFAGISHDLRTPISRIHLALELLENCADKELLETIRSDLDEMNYLIGQTLELATSREKALEKLERIDLNQLISDEVEKFRPKYPLINWQPGERCMVSVSPGAVQRILQNLLQNAIRYGQDKEINITLSRQDNKVRLCVTDQGDGIPQASKKQIFQPFFRLEQSRNTQTGGTGLGLAIVAQLCEIYGWQITLNSTLHHGSQFCLEIND